MMSIQERSDEAAADSTRASRLTNAAANYIDERTSLSAVVAEFGRKIFPDHWSFMLGEVALWSLVSIFITGTFLTFFFQPSQATVIYGGSYVPLKGIQMSAALDSVLHISFDVRGGLLIRQVHHWSALLFVAATGLHMLRTFFTGSFRKPRELNWFFGFILFILALAEGFTGYSLPDDLLSGNGLRIIDGLVKAVPVVGTWISDLLFGGEFPGTKVISVFYSLHILLLFGALIVVLGIHLVLVIVNKHTQFNLPGNTNSNVVGLPILPTFGAKIAGFLFIVLGVLFLTGAIVQINPVWVYGPYDPSPISAGTQPDWYIGFADGVLRLVPPGWEVVIGGYTLSLNILVPIVVLLVFLAVVCFYPFIEAWITGDKREYHFADRPRNAPTRTSIGAAGVTLYGVMWAAASSDLIATHFGLSIEQVIHTLQVLIFVGPMVAYMVTKRICIALQKRDHEIALHGFETGRIVRLPGGRYEEVHAQLSDFERWKLLDYADNAPLTLRPNKRGRITAGMRLRVRLSEWFFEDRIAPPTRTEIESAAHQE